MVMCLGRDCIGLTDNEPLFRQTNKEVKFLKTLWCCVGEGYNKIIWHYQVS